MLRMAGLTGRTRWRLSLALALALPAGAYLATGCGPDPCSSRVSDAAHDEQAAIVAAAPPLSVTEDAGLRALYDWESLPGLRSDRYEQFSSRNRTAEHVHFGGKDFNNFLALLGSVRPLLLAIFDQLDLAAGQPAGYVLADTDAGPGYVSRMFFTRFRGGDLTQGAEFFTQPDLGAFENEVLRIYVDDLSTPAFVLPVADLGATLPFAAPFAGLGCGAVTSYLPISFTQRLRVALDGLCPLNGYFYHVAVKYTEQTTRPFSLRLADDPDYAAAAGLLAAQGTNPNRGFTLVVDNAPLELAAGASTAAFTTTGAGTVKLLQFALDESSAARLRDVQLSISFDQAASPAIDVPLAAFFGCWEQFAPFVTLPMRVQHSENRWELACYLPLPFATSVQVALRNVGAAPVTLRTSVGLDHALPSQPWGHLHARFHAVAGPQPDGAQFEVANIAGRGRYVGTFLFVAGNSEQRPGELSASLNILEGNDTAIIDAEPRLHGTGTEDYFNGGFYFAGGPFDSPFAAANYVKGGVDNDPGVVSCCRWHVLSDAIDFQRSFELRFQYGNDDPALVERYAGVAYYYLDRPEP
jgi:hypothetical protein